MGKSQHISADNGAWTFGNNVSETFVDHIKLSVPLYENGHDLICQLAPYFVKDDSVVYEIGTSTGELLRKLAVTCAGKANARFVGLDVETEMVAAAAAHCADMSSIEIREEDIRLADLEKADMIVSYYTMQFIPPRHRQDIFDKIYERLNWGGAFIMFEKVRGPDARFQDILTQLYNDFKLANGFSPEDIIEKTRSLKGVLEPFSTEGNLDLLARAGFVDVMSIQRYLCFEGFLAIK